MKFKYLTFLLALLLLPVLSFAKAKDVVQVSIKKPTFSISLAANRTTGYSWFVQRYNPHLLEPLKQEYLQPKKGLIGAGGQSVFTFKALPQAFKVQHLMTITFVYARPWEMKAAKTMEYKVVTQQ